jgi:hypothetical protein
LRRGDTAAAAIEVLTHGERAVGAALGLLSSRL